MNRWILIAVASLAGASAWGAPPNIILMMADDMGYGDTGFNGNEVIRTPHLDQLAKDGALLTHFYSVGPVCSPTRGACVTGRHYFRYGIYSANTGHLPAQEITLARMLKEKGYTTGHFGKWHLGTLSRTMSSKGAKRHPERHFAPPWERDYDRSFVTESAVATWDPGLGKRSRNNPFYDDGRPVDPNDDSLKGGAARVIVDRVVPFMEQAVENETPFLAVVWFHAPHEDIVAGPDYLAMYEGKGDAGHYYGCVTELDEQVGRIRETLAKLEAADNTLIFYCSDNGPEGKEVKGRKAGTTRGLRGRKRSLYDGGVRVPAAAVWPGRIQPGTLIDTPCSTLDYFPTIRDIVGYRMPDERPIDGQDMLPILQGKEKERTLAIPFRHGNGASLVKDRFKLMMPSGELYDLSRDWGEERNVASEHPERVEQMGKELKAFLDSFQASQAGADYNDRSFEPVGRWKALPASTPPKKEKPGK